MRRIAATAASGLIVMAVFALSAAGAVSAAIPQPKVVIIVGPVSGSKAY